MGAPRFRSIDSLTVGTIGRFSPSAKDAPSCDGAHSRRVHKWTRLERFGRGGSRPAPRPRSKFADFPPPAAEPLARLLKNSPIDGQFFTRAPCGQAVPCA